LILSLRRDRDLLKFSQDRDETKTFDFKSVTRPRPSQIFSRPRQDETETFDFGSETETFSTETETFFDTLHTSELYVFCKATTTITSSIHTFIFNNLNKYHESSWHYQEFSYCNFKQLNSTTAIDVKKL